MRKLLFKLLGVDALVRRAFQEGWDMHKETDLYLCEGLVHAEWLDVVIDETRTWRSIQEAWANSDVEEEV